MLLLLLLMMMTMVVSQRRGERGVPLGRDEARLAQGARRQGMLSLLLLLLLLLRRRWRRERSVVRGRGRSSRLELA